MFQCSVCLDSKLTTICPKFSSGESFIAHYQLYHCKEIAQGKMVCCHTNCFGRKFNLFNSFKKHVWSHKVSFHVETCDNYLVADSNYDADTNSAEDGLDGDLPTEDSIGGFEDPYFSNVKESVNFDEALTNSVVAFIADLYNRGSFNDSQIQLIIDSHMQLLGGSFLSVLKCEVINLLSKACDAGVVTDKNVKNV